MTFFAVVARRLQAYKCWQPVGRAEAAGFPTTLGRGTGCNLRPACTNSLRYGFSNAIAEMVSNKNCAIMTGILIALGGDFEVGIAIG